MAPGSPRGSNGQPFNSSTLITTYFIARPLKNLPEILDWELENIHANLRNAKNGKSEGFILGFFRNVTRVTFGVVTGAALAFSDPGYGYQS